MYYLYTKQVYLFQAPSAAAELFAVVNSNAATGHRCPLTLGHRLTCEFYGQNLRGSAHKSPCEGPFIGLTGVCANAVPAAWDDSGGHGLE